MTTIAADARRGIMCSDSYWTDGTTVGLLRKVHRIRGELVGFAGDAKPAAEWIRAWKADPLGVHAGSMRHCNVEVLLMSNGALAHWDRTNGWTALEEKRYAIGTGGDAARGAMKAGASCREAVAIASSIDAATKGPVRQYRLR